MSEASMPNQMSISTPISAAARRLSLLLTLVPVMLLCLATPSSAQDQGPNLMAYLYAPVTDVTNRFGTPKTTQHLANGDTILIYHWSRSQTEGGYTVSNAGPLYPTGLAGGTPYSGSPVGTARWYEPTQTVELPCDARFTVNKDGEVRDISWDGNGCLSD
jgi:hypothetical protein